MNIKSKSRTKPSKPIVIKEITLLSIEEYNDYKDIIPYIKNHWWLRTPGTYPLNACFVDSCGRAHRGYYNVSSSFISIRPALICEPVAVKRGKIIKYGGFNWTALNKTLLVCTEIVAHHRFDDKSNVWESSELKKWLNEELRALLDKQQLLVKNAELNERKRK